MRATLDIIIVNWNAGNQLRECLESITAAGCKGFDLKRVVVVDNASTDGSAKCLNDLPLPLTIVENKENRGFAAACNQGATGSKADYLLFLNPDTKLFEKSLEVPIGFMEQPENKKVAITGIQLVADSGEVERTCARFPTPGRIFSKMLGLDRLFPRFFPSHFMLEWNHLESREVDQVMGAFFLVRRSVFETLGGFDERFFVYMEDLDFSLCAQDLGCQSYYLADAKAYHKGGGSSEQVKAVRMFYSLRSRILYGYKHFGRPAADVLLIATILIEPFSRLTLAIGHRSVEQIKETLLGCAMLWRSMPTILKTTWDKKQ